MKFQSLMATTLAVTIGSAILAQTPAEKIRPAATENVRPTEPDLQEKLDVYVGHLKHGSVEQRLDAVHALGRIGERAKAAAPALVEALKYEDEALRVAAAEALWHANKDPAAVTALVAALMDKVDDMDWAKHPSATAARSNAVEALDRIGPEAKAAVPALLVALEEGWIWERAMAAWSSSVELRRSGCHCSAGRPLSRLSPGQAAWLLWRIEKHPSVMPALLKALKDPVHRSGAAQTLGRIGVEAKAAVPALVKLLHDDNGARSIDVVTQERLTREREAITYGLWQINKHPAYIHFLVEGLQHKNPSVRVGYIYALGRIGAEAKAAVPAVAEALKDEKGFVGRAATEALGNIGPEAKAAVPALLEALKGSGRMRVAAADALWRINKHPAAVPALTETLQDPTDYADYNANSALRRVGAEAKAAAPALAEALKEKNADRRVHVAMTLWRINKDPAVVPVLVDALKDMEANGYTRVWVAKTLWQINKHPAAEPALIEVLKDKDASLRNYAAEVLWQINRHPAAVPALVETLKGRHSWEGSPAASVLGRIGAEAKVAEAALVAAFQDEDEGVRTSAAQCLKKMDLAAAKKAGVK